MVTKQSKKYFLSVVEESVMDPMYYWGRGGRIEIHELGKKFPIMEARFFVPKEIIDEFRKMFDFKEFDHLPIINFPQIEP